MTNGVEMNGTEHNPARVVEPLSERLPSSLTEAIALLEESRIQCIELKIMLDAAENYVAGADSRDRQAQAALAEMRQALTEERRAREEIAAELEEIRAAGYELGEELIARREQCQQLRQQLEAGESERERLRAELTNQQIMCEQLRNQAAGSGDAPAELLAQLQSQQAASEQLRAELAEERTAYDELQTKMNEQTAAWGQARADLDSDHAEELQMRLKQLETELRESREKHELAIAAQLREIQRSNEAERTAVAKLKGLEQELSILQARASMLAARNEPEAGKGDDKSSGLMSRFVGRFRRE
ncbi:MAG TPA: hypothetical protein VEB21_00590 [Terriglobales bacterium]|nr:hypothetical protein [Terriglobales bacterium]